MFGDGFDVHGSAGGVAEDVADLHDRGVEAMVKVDIRIGGPEKAAKVFAGDDISGVLEQLDENAERLLPELDAYAAAAKLHPERIDFVDAEAPCAGAIFQRWQKAIPRPRSSAARIARNRRKRGRAGV